MPCMQAINCNQILCLIHAPTVCPYCNGIFVGYGGCMNVTWMWHVTMVAIQYHVFDATYRWVNTLRPRQDGHHFADDIFTCIFFNENCCILIRFSLKYVHKGLIDNNPALVQIMAWRRSGDKPLSEPMMISLPTHICVTRPYWVNARKTWLQCIRNGVVSFLH